MFGNLFKNLNPFCKFVQKIEHLIEHSVQLTLSEVSDFSNIFLNSNVVDSEGFECTWSACVGCTVVAL